MHIGIVDRMPFIILGGEVCRIIISSKGVALLTSYSIGDGELTIDGIPALMVILGWICVGQIVWLVERPFIWPLILLGFFLWWGAEAFMPKEGE